MVHIPMAAGLSRAMRPLTDARVLAEERIIAGRVREGSAAWRFLLETLLCALLSSLLESRAQRAGRSDQRALPHTLDTGGFSTDRQESLRACWWAIAGNCRTRTWESPDSG